MSIKQNDISLIKDILGGSQQAFKTLYNKYSKFYLLTCLRYVKNRADAEDLLQESVIKIYKDLHQFDAERGNFLSWSKRIVINTCLQKLRKNNVLNGFENIFEINHSFSVRPLAHTNLNLQDLTGVIQQLPKGYRTVFNMYVIDGFSHKEIADQLKISVSTSKTQLMKAKKMLQNNLSQSDYNLISSYA